MSKALNWLRKVFVQWLHLDELSSDVDALRHVVEVQAEEIGRLQDEIDGIRGRRSSY